MNQKDKTKVLEYVKAIKTHLKSSDMYRFNKSNGDYGCIDIACRFIARKEKNVEIKEGMGTSILKRSHKVK
jgi:hypothetical protein